MPAGVHPSSNEVDVRKAITLLFLMLPALAAQAETRYVTDVFNIMMRSGESSSHRILRQLPSGTPLEVISVNEETGYTQVRTSGDTTGYVLTRQLMDEASARDRLAATEERLRALQEEPDKLAGRLTALQDEYQTLQAEHSRLQRVNTELEQELEGIRRTAADAVRISNERNELRKTLNALTRQVEDLKQKNRDLSHKTAQNWFLIGGGVVVLGIILGLILPHLRFRRRKNSWGSL
jgi:SH3 domain protein